MNTATHSRPPRPGLLIFAALALAVISLAASAPPADATGPEHVHFGCCAVVLSIAGAAALHRLVAGR